jgi:hypothetical protein
VADKQNDKQNKDYYSFDQVLSDLRMEEEELKRLVSAGEIRAFREKDTMRFKAADIERLKSASDGGGDDLEIDLGEELDLGDDLELDLGEGGAEEIDLAAEFDDGGLEVEEMDLGGGKSAPTRRVPRSQAVAAEAIGSEGAGMLFVLGLGFVVLIFANFAALGAVTGTTNALTGFVADMFGS